MVDAERVWAAYRTSCDERETPYGLPYDDVASAWSAAKEAWPDLRLSAETFGRALAESTGRTESAPPLIADLALAAQCLHGDRHAIAILERHVSSAATRVASRVGLNADDLVQRVCADLISGPRPTLRGYRGRGLLRSWVQVVVKRTALNMRRGQAEVVPLEDEFCDPIVRTTPEVALLRVEDQGAFVEAFRCAYRALTADDRALLRDYHVVGRTQVELGESLGIHPSNVGRRLATARARLLSAFENEGQGPAGGRLLSSRLEFKADDLLRSKE